MTLQDLKTFGMMFKQFVTFFHQGRILPPATVVELVEGYFDNLSELSLEQVKLVLERAKQECRFLPTIAELRELAGYAPAKTPMERLKDKAEEVWRQLIVHEFDPVSGVYRYYCREVIDNDPIARQCFRELGGGYDFGKWKLDQLRWKAREFAASYIQLSLGKTYPALDPGLSREDAQRFLHDSGLEDLLGPMPQRREEEDADEPSYD
jgi:hypothetical protein